MSSQYQARCHAAVHEHFGQFLTAWLATLPRDGWTGTAADLTATLATFNEQGNHRAIVPGGSGLSKFLMQHEADITAAGWSLEFRRSKSARLIAFRKGRRRMGQQKSGAS